MFNDLDGREQIESIRTEGSNGTLDHMPTQRLSQGISSREGVKSNSMPAQPQELIQQVARAATDVGHPRWTGVLHNFAAAMVLRFPKNDLVDQLVSEVESIESAMSPHVSCVLVGVQEISLRIRLEW